MNKIVFILFFAIVGFIAKAQTPFIYYEPLTIPGTNNSTSDPYWNDSRTSQQADNNFQVINAYFINSRGTFEKIRIKVNVLDDRILGIRVYVRGYYDKRYDMWYSVNNMANKVSIHDEDVIRENFDWCCYVSPIGKIYF